MGYKRKQSNKDKSHKQHVEALTRIGASVIEADGVGKSVADLIVSLRPTDTVAIEVKEADGMFAIAQLRWLAEWRGYSAFSSSPEETLRIVRTPQLYALSEKDKMKILRIVMRYENKTKAKYPQISVARFEALFKGN